MAMRNDDGSMEARVRRGDLCVDCVVQTADTEDTDQPSLLVEGELRATPCRSVRGDSFKVCRSHMRTEPSMQQTTALRQSEATLRIWLDWPPKMCIGACLRLGCTERKSQSASAESDATSRELVKMFIESAATGEERLCGRSVRTRAARLRVSQILTTPSEEPE